MTDRKTYIVPKGTHYWQQTGPEDDLEIWQTNMAFHHPKYMSLVFVRKSSIEEFREKYPDFWPWEFASPDIGNVLIQVDMMDRLQEARTRLDHPFMITSGYRTREANAAAGSNEYSYHRKGMAVDISVVGIDPMKLCLFMHQHGFEAQGAYPDSLFAHFDTGPEARWGNWDEWQRGQKKAREPVEVKDKRNDKIVGAVSGAGVIGLGQSFITSGLPQWFIMAGIVIIVAGAGIYFYKRSGK